MMGRRVHTSLNGRSYATAYWWKLAIFPLRHFLTWSTVLYASTATTAFRIGPTPSRTFKHVRLRATKEETKQQLSSMMDELVSQFSFPLDHWQIEAGRALLQNHNVICCAPTGAGKTVVGELGLVWARMQAKRAIYTTPLKALSNEKYREFGAMFDSVGLSTGDVSISKGSNVTVMTTEVYRNIAWRSSDEELADTALVVLDEFHYMGLPNRGGVWEECIILSPNHTQIVGLSATLSNAPELAAWMEHVTQRPTLLVQVPASERPVPLRYLYATKDGIQPLFRDPDAGPGAPHGLLGLRGDGDASLDVTNKKRTNKKRKEKQQRRGFGGFTDAGSTKSFPRGLQVNPTLALSATKRLERIDKTLQRQKVRRTFEGVDELQSRPALQAPRRLSPREERKERERLLKKEMRRVVPSLFFLVTRLDQRSQLPAIFFLFSRAGCDNAAQTVCRSMQGPRVDSLDVQAELLSDFEDAPAKKQKSRQRGKKKRPALLQDSEGRSFRSDGDFVTEDLLIAALGEDRKTELDFDEESPLAESNWLYYSKAGLLDYDQVQQVAGRVAVFNARNPEIEFNDDQVEQFLFGIGSHHAGQLPAHKSFVEVLFQNQLMKVVFATETLAAGINMPARSTVICALAKRGDGSSMNLLETSNLQQMAGRAGRRGKDSEGYCIIVATPFEGHDDAANILTDEIKPISSQFSPSYSLCINLVDRGMGKLDVAKQLVRKSFAMWEKNQTETSAENQEPSLVADGFLKSLSDCLRVMTPENVATESANDLSLLLEDRSSLLKRSSKRLAGATKQLELERATADYLSEELQNMQDAVTEPEESAMVLEDLRNLVDQLDLQLIRVREAEAKLRNHPFSVATRFCNQVTSSNTHDGRVLSKALSACRKSGYIDDHLTAEELSSIAKAAITERRDWTKRQRHEQRTPNEALSTKGLPLKDSWDDFMALVNTLVAYGCLSPSSPDLEQSNFTVTKPGKHIQLLGFENALWVLTALGGTFDMLGASYGRSFNGTNEDGAWQPRLESQALVDSLTTMTPSELAGYIACIISDGSRDSGSMIDQFSRLDNIHQQAIQHALGARSRLVETQKLYGVDSNVNCVLDISNCIVVTAWAEGCNWQEALELSGLPPGDLARTLSRVLDAVRQLGNLPYIPVRKSSSSNGHENQSPGIDPTIRLLCREASRAINRYPVKDTFMFAEEEHEELLEDDDTDHTDGSPP